MKTVFKNCFFSFAVGFVASGALAAQPTTQEKEIFAVDGAKVTVLLKSTHAWDGARYSSYPKGQPELTVLKLIIPPHSDMPWHTHPMPSAVYVQTGTLTVQTDDGREIKLIAGEVLPDSTHTVTHGLSGDEPLELILFYPGTPGMPVAHPINPNSLPH
ncbi:cupin domain-containing protein [Paraburkholderia humisilvae]|uniref:Cupin type-2 domain-containing protein n=1 Tax=Paraburkholderia humisilvae TaxID=627669 RepID=A0A6J5F750_9BURK|nr:cupin domain-containing protein [Paraburkholderia humisilvae]CAB3774738.1 hypothetical protein LMG29542_08116 [Paraburkholderia humisilvae]